MSVTIRVAEHAGACYGVTRALELALGCALEHAEPVHTLGPLIHNPIVVEELAEQGVGLAQSLDEIDRGSVIIRSHGVVPQVIEDARARGLSVVDATCPYVKKVHKAASNLVHEGYDLIIVGESGHPEVEGIVGHAEGKAHVVASPQDLDGVTLGKRVGVVVQTTQTAANLSAVVAALAPLVSELRVVNTICAATSERQRAAVVPFHENLPLIVHEVHFALRAGKNGMIRVFHRIEPDAGAGGILLPNEIHHFSVHHRFLHVLLSVVKLQLVDHAAILLSGILHLDRRTIKDVIAGFPKIGVEALAVVAGGEGMLRLILDLGIEAHRLHRGHHTGQPHHIRVIGVADGLKLHTGPYEPLQLGKALESDRLSLLF
mgnify:CR=1 FL=1